MSRFLKGGDPISLGSQKKSSDFKRVVQWSDGGGGPVHLYTRVRNLAYLDATE